MGELIAPKITFKSLFQIFNLHQPRKDGFLTEYDKIKTKESLKNDIFPWQLFLKILTKKRCLKKIKERKTSER